MVADPQLNQSTAIAKSTATDNRLSALLPNVASEYSPLKVYLPTAQPELSQGGADTSPYSGPSVWVAPDLNGDGSDYTVQVECIGGGGGGGGSYGARGFTPTPVAAAGNTSAGTSITGPFTSPYVPAGSTLIVAVQTGNTTAQTVTVTDTAGNVYKQIGSASSPGTTPAFQSWLFAATNATALGLSSVPSPTFTVTTTNSEILGAVVYVIGDSYGLSSAGSASFVSTVSSTATLESPGTWLANDDVLTFWFNNSATNWGNPVSSTGGSTTWSNIDQAVGGLAVGNSRIGTTWDQRSTARAGATDDCYRTVASATAVPAIAMSVAVSCAHIPGSTAPGGGGGGGEYACETDYPVTPGEAYTYALPEYALGGRQTNPGDTGGATIFDLHGFGIEGGVVANGGQGGQFGGSPGAGGTGSGNAVHFDGGAGGGSSAGIATDNPLGFPNMAPGLDYWLTLDESANTSTPLLHAGGQDSSFKRYAGPGSSAGASAAVHNPLQVPASRLPGTAAGNCWRFALGSTSKGATLMADSIRSGSSAITASVWIRGDISASSSTDWGNATATLLTNRGSNNFTSANTGYLVYLLNGVLHANIGIGSARIDMAGPAISAVDGNWHQIVLSYDGSAGVCTLYVDGAVYQTRTGFTGIAAWGDLPDQVAGSYGLSANYFKGFMSNPWVSQSFGAGGAITATQVAQVYGTLTSTGGGGGGASGGSAGTGSAGGSATGTSGGAAGSATAAATNITTGSNAGSPGVAQGTNGLGYAVGGNGGGGSGAGAAIGNANNGTLYSITETAQRSATYTGMDASASGGDLFSLSDDLFNDGDTIPDQTTSTALCVTGGKPENPVNGTMNSILQFPPIGKLVTTDGSPLNALSGGVGLKWMIDSMYLTLTINTTNAANIAISVGHAAELPTELTDTELSTYTDVAVAPIIFSIPAGDAGRQVSLNLGGAAGPIEGLLASSDNVFLIIGTLRGSLLDDFNNKPFDYGNGGYTDPENAEWYCEFYGTGTDQALQDASLSVNYYLANGGGGSPPGSGGAGGAGYIKISYLNPEGTPITTILPNAATDGGGNGLASGVTTDGLQTWQPGTNPKQLETWHNLTPLKGAAGNLPTTNVLRYKRIPGNMVMLQMTLIYAAGNYITLNANIASLPPLYAPSQQVEFAAGTYVQSGTQHGVRCSISTGGVIGVSDGGLTVSEVHACVVFPLD